MGYKLIKAARFVLIAVIIGLLWHYFANRIDQQEILKGLNFDMVPLLLIVAALFFVLSGCMLKDIVRLFGVKASLLECVGIAALTSLANFIALPGGGALGKAVYLKRRHQFPYASFVATMSTIHILDIFFAALLGAVAILISGRLSDSAFMPILWGLVFMCAVILSMIGILGIIGTQKWGKAKFVKGIIEGWQIIGNDRRLIARLGVLMLAGYFLAATEVIAGFGAFSIRIGITEALLLAVISTLTMIVKITPANLGVQEVVVAASSHILGVGFDNGLVVAGLLRLVSIAITFTLGGVSILLLSISGKQETLTEVK